MSPITNATDLLNASAVGTAEARQPPKNTLGKDDFLKLLTGQLRNQDPMKPMEDKDFMGQMAQFSQLEQITNLAASMQDQQAFNLIGKTVTYANTDTGQLATGKVEKVSIQGGKTTLTIGGISGIASGAITEVLGEGAAPTTGPTDGSSTPATGSTDTTGTTETAGS